MSSMMPPPMGKPGMGGPPLGGDPIKENRSFGNPMDLAAMKTEGDITPDMSVEEFFTQLGIDVKGPVTQLTEFAQKQSQNKDALGKMGNIAKSGGKPPGMGGPPPPPPGMGGPAGPPPGMDGLLG